jgi:hypothetical protein
LALDEAEGRHQFGVIGGDLTFAGVLGAPLHAREDILFFGFIGAEPRGQGGRLRGSAAATAAVVVVVVARTRGGGAAVGVRREGGRHRRSPVGPAPRRPLLAAHRATCSKLNTGFEALAAGTEARRGGRWDGLHVYAAERFVSTEVWISGGGVVFGEVRLWRRI